MLPACAFEFEVSSSRTALENQVLGSFKEIEDDLVLVSGSRGTGDPAPALDGERKKAVEARLNQDFNRDDVDELKEKEILGEAADGELTLLPSNIAKAAVSASDQKLARTLVAEENRDRVAIWRATIAGNRNLSAKNLPDVRRTYARQQRDNAGPGHWYQDESGRWQKKDGVPPKV